MLISPRAAPCCYDCISSRIQAHVSAWCHAASLRYARLLSASSGASNAVFSHTPWESSSQCPRHVLRINCNEVKDEMPFSVLGSKGVGPFGVDRMVRGKDAQERCMGFQRDSRQAHRDSTRIQETLNICPDLDIQTQRILRLSISAFG